MIPSFLWGFTKAMSFLKAKTHASRLPGCSDSRRKRPMKLNQKIGYLASKEIAREQFRRKRERKAHTDTEQKGRNHIVSAVKRKDK